MLGNRPPFCIIGPGAIGLTLAALLSQNHEVYLLGHAHHIPELENNPIQVQGFRHIEISPGQVKIVQSANASRIPAGAHIISCVKAYHLANSLAHWEPALQRARSLSLCSNGLNVFLEAATRVPRSLPLLRLLPSFGVKRDGPNTVVLAGALKSTIASRKVDQSHCNDVAQLLQKVGVQIRQAKDIATAEWEKALINIVVNTICTLYDVPNGELVRNSKLRKLGEQALSETISVAAAEGFDLSHYADSTSEHFLFQLLSDFASNVNSTLEDLRHGKQTETDFILGRFLSIASQYEVNCPTLCELYAQLVALEKQRGVR